MNITFGISDPKLVKKHTSQSMSFFWSSVLSIEKNRCHKIISIKKRFKTNCQADTIQVNVTNIKYLHTSNNHDFVVEFNTVDGIMILTSYIFLLCRIEQYLFWCDHHSTTNSTTCMGLITMSMIKSFIILYVFTFYIYIYQYECEFSILIF